MFKLSNGIFQTTTLVTFEIFKLSIPFEIFKLQFFSSNGIIKKMFKLELFCYDIFLSYSLNLMFKHFGKFKHFYTLVYISWRLFINMLPITH
jgi:hypothetical protein